MRFNRFLATLGLVSFAAGAVPASAHEAIYSASLLGSSETPAAITPGTGLGTVTIDLDLLTMRVQASFSGLLGNTTASHIHCCTANPFSGNIGVATQTPTFIDFPLGVKAGTYDHTFDMSLASSYNAPFITNNGGTVGSAFNALVAGLDAGKAYLNVHTTLFPGGEIRALLAPVPEPTTYLLMVVGLAVIGGVARRRSTAA